MRTFENRREMIAELVKPGDSVLEIGVFRGDFAKDLLARNPRRLVLCDPWDGVNVSGDADGNHVEAVDLEQAYQQLLRTYNGDLRVFLLRGRSPGILSVIPSESLQFIYIDGDHSYQGCKADLEEAWRLVAPGGWICGHDYEMNAAKTSAVYDFGVQAAVDEFLAIKKLELGVKALDGCVSYGFQKPAEFQGFEWGC